MRTDAIAEYDAVFFLLQTAVNDARMLNIARSLVRMGNRVAIVAYGRQADTERLAQESIHLYAVPGSTLGRLAFRWPAFNRYARRALQHVRARSCWAEDVFSLPLAAQSARRWRARLLYDSREIYSALGTLGGRPLRQRFISGLEAYYMRRLDACFVSGALDAEYLAEHYRCPKPLVLENLPPYREVRESHILRERFKLNKATRIVLYQGGIFRGKGLARMVRALPCLPGYVFCVAGDGEYISELRKLAHQEGVEQRLLFCGKIPYDNLPEWTASAHVGLCLIEPLSFSYQLALPNKLFEYCMAGIPSLVSDLPAMRPVVERYGIGTLVAAEIEPRELAAVIEQLCEPSQSRAYREACRVAARELCWERQETRIAQLIEH